MSSGFELTGLSEFTAKLERVSVSVSAAAEAAVTAGGKILEEEIRNGVKLAADRGYATGELVESIKMQPAKKSAGGASVTISPRGSVKRGKGKAVRNSDKAWYLEHGTARQAAHPFMQKALNDARPKVMEAMQREIDAAIASAGGRS